ncbi:SLC13 family permease [Clostridium sp. C105KSO13]|uniref:SLC13 family permease n=1 Tax=Clostridium sp. C105KSO13 TaxID=1776045 RepID=UPI0007405A8E|nr:SLC13 family permease [Clostridium sp. C105KSO13]CUX47910.1 hypothetical protein BN3456_02712 [Clostridium sp. C105KSO13]
MGIAGISLLLLVLAILIGFFRKINVGVIAILFAVILGYGSGLFTGKEVIAGFSGSLFLTLAGVTLLFAIVRSNGALELLMKKVIAKTGRAVVLVPIIVFVFSWLVSASGPGLIPTAALIAVLVIPIAHETGFHPVMLAAIGVHAANAGRFTMLTVEGNLVTSLLAEQGYTENIMFPLCLSVTILAVILSVLAYIWYKGYKVKASDIYITGFEQHFTRQQILSLGGMLVMAVLILIFKYETGLAALSVSAVLILLKVCDESVAIKNVPWGTIILVTGVGVLMNLVIACGGIDILSGFLGSIMTPATASALSGVTAGILSWFSSTLGVVIPTLVPTVGNIIEQVGGNVTVLEIVAAIGFTSSSAGLSPASTAGALIMGAIGGDSEFSQKYKADKLFVELFAWAAVSIVFIALIALTGYFRWFV